MTFGGRGPFGIVLRAGLRAAWLPVAIATVVAAAMTPAARNAAGESNAGAGANGLALPFAVAAFVVGMQALRQWPLFAQRRPGGEWLHRLQRGPWHGTGAALAGALLAQALLTLPVALGLPMWLGAPPVAHTVAALSLVGEPRLDARHPAVVLQAPAAGPWRQLVLRPIAFLPEGPAMHATVRVRAEATELGPMPPITDTGQRVARSFAPLAATHFTVERLAGDIPLYFAPDTAHAYGAAEHTGWWNSLRGWSVALLPTFVALASACLCGAFAALPTVTTVFLALAFVATFGGVGPFAPTLRAWMRGEWAVPAELLAATLPTAALGSVLMAFAMVARRRLRA